MAWPRRPTAWPTWRGFANRVTFVIGKDGKVTSVIEGKDAIDPTATLSACKPAPKP